VAAPHTVGQHDRVERVLHTRPHPDPLMTVQQQGSEIPVLRGRHPNRRKPTLVQQLQQQRRIAAIVFLLARFGLTNRRGMTHATLNRELLHQPEKPAHRARRFDPDDDRRRNRGIERADGPAFVHQCLLDDLTGVAIQHRDRLLARM
jgi:hypothetical protein